MAARRRPGPPRKNPECLLDLERLDIGETLELLPEQEFLLEVSTQLPLSPKMLAAEIATRGAGLRAVAIMRTAPSWWPVLDTNSAYHIHLVFEGKEPSVFPLPAKVKRLWLVRLPPRNALPDVPQLPPATNVSPSEAPPSDVAPSE